MNFEQPAYTKLAFKAAVIGPRAEEGIGQIMRLMARLEKHKPGVPVKPVDQSGCEGAKGVFRMMDIIKEFGGCVRSDILLREFGGGRTRLDNHIRSAKRSGFIDSDGLRPASYTLTRRGRAMLESGWNG